MYAVSTSLSKGDKKDAAVHVWDLESGCIVRAFRGGVCSPRSLYASKSLLLGGQVGRPAVHAWTPQTEKLHLKIPLSEKISCLTATSDNYICATGNNTGGVSVWEIATGNLLCTLPTAHYRRVVAVKFTCDGSHLITGSDDATVRVWKTLSLVGGGRNAIGAAISPVHTWSDHTLPVTDIFCGFGGLSSRVVTSSKDSSCKLYDLASGALLHSFAFETDVQSVVMDATEQLLFAGGGNGIIYTCNVSTEDGTNDNVAAPLSSTRRPFMGHKLAVTCVAVSFDACTLVSGSEDGTVRVWDIESRQCTKVYDHKDAVTNVMVIPQAWITSDDNSSVNNAVVSLFSRKPFVLDSSAMIKTSGVSLMLAAEKPYQHVSSVSLVPDASDLRVSSLLGGDNAMSSNKNNNNNAGSGKPAEVEQWQQASETLYTAAVGLLLSSK
eukprot:m.103857 g.103857  ORF g.103857 m.103857 type:complete len:437 (+) comp27521_c2_seq1:131-1441(+)